MLRTPTVNSIPSHRFGHQRDIAGAPDGLFALDPGSIWAAFRRQPLSFWLVSLYMLFEYIRPQAIYTFLQPVPWAQIFILAAPIAFLLEKGRLKARDPIDTWIAIFSVAVVLSWATALYPQYSADKMSVMVNWILAYILVANLAATEEKFFLFYLLFLLASFKMSQFGTRTWIQRGFGFASWGATGAPGWFHNSGEFGIQMCIFLPLTLYLIAGLRSYWVKWKRMLVMVLPVTAVMSVVATNSRGALVGVAGVGLWMLLRTRYRVRALVSIAVVSLLVYQIMPQESRDRFSNMGTDDTSESRKTYWRHGIEIYKAHPVSGIGYENWAEYYQSHYGRTTLPHNIFIQAAAELGSVGLVALCGMIVASFLVNARTRRLASRLGPRGKFLESTARGLDGAMIGFLGSAFFVTVLYYPYLWFGLGLTSALHAVALKEVAKGAGPMPTVGVPLPRSGWRTPRPQLSGRLPSPAVPGA